MRINFYPSYGLNPYTGYGRMELGIAKGLQLAGGQYQLYPSDEAPTLLIGNPQLFNSPHIRHTARSAFTMSETTRASDFLVETLNTVCEQVIVPCPPLIDYYRESGVQRDLHFIGLGVDLFVEGDRPPLSQPDARPFTFMTYSYGDRRKGGEIAVAAFKQLFSGDPHFQLLIKAREGVNRTWLAALRDPQIRVLSGYQSEDEWLAQLGNVHCFVFPSRGEGWGMPPRDATLLGVPAIATQWLGMWDVAEWGIPLQVSALLPAHIDVTDVWNAPGALWAEPDFEHLKSQMQWVVDHYAQARELARHGRAYLLEHYRWQQVGEQLLDLIAR